MTTEDLLKSLPRPVAVVGNGPLRLMGKEIDSAGSVIRLNNFTTEGWEDLAGSRIDAWCVNCWWDVPWRSLGVPAFTVFHEQDDSNRPGRWAQKMGAPTSALILPHVRWSEAVRAVKPKHPTCGIILLYALQALGMPTRAYGFDGLRSGHYWDPGHLHDHACEDEALKRLGGIGFR